MMNADNNFTVEDIVNMSGSISGLQQYNVGTQSQDVSQQWQQQ